MRTFSLFLLMTLLVPVLASAEIRSPDQVIREIGIDQKLNAQIPADLAFFDEQGNPVRLWDFYGKKPVILSLVYYECPMLCSMVLNGLVKALRPLKLEPGRDFEMVTVSFDPTEKPELARKKKAGYVESYGRAGAHDAWHFLTGDEASIRRLTEAVGFRYLYDERSGEYAHAGAIYVLTPKGHLARYFYGIEYSSRDLRFSLIEAAQGRIGSFVDQILLLCYHYDPLTGKYGFWITGALRLGGLLTLVLLGGGVGMMLLREKRAGLSVG